jgi:membrane protein YqaA with SNARE-associated domain
MIGTFLAYIQITLLSFFVNVIPAFAPPTWIVLSLYKLSHIELNSFAIAFFGVVGSVAGRLVMYYYSKVLGKYLPKKGKSHLNYLKKLGKGKNLQLFVLTFLYSLSPLPSNFLFIVSGMSGIKIGPVITGFAIGRLVSYSLLVYGVFRASTLFRSIGIENITFFADILGILASIIIIFVDWKKLFGKRKQSPEKF